MCPVLQFMKTPAPAAGLVLTMLNSGRIEYHVVHLHCVNMANAVSTG